MSVQYEVGNVVRVAKSPYSYLKKGTMGNVVSIERNRNNSHYDMLRVIFPHEPTHRIPLWEYEVEKVETNAS